jgi:hypothetical protein
VFTNFKSQASITAASQSQQGMYAEAKPWEKLILLMNCSILQILMMILAKNKGVFVALQRLL